VLFSFTSTCQRLGVEPWACPRRADALAIVRREGYAMLSVFCSPCRYTQGKNATAALGQELTNLGLRGPALIVAGRSAVRLLAATC
jgi:hypothetical protein